MGLDRILAATDFSGRSERAIERAALLCRDHSAALGLLHVVDDDQPAEVVRQGRLPAAALLTDRDAALHATTLVGVGVPFPDDHPAGPAGNAALSTMVGHATP